MYLGTRSKNLIYGQQVLNYDRSAPKPNPRTVVASFVKSLMSILSKRKNQISAYIAPFQNKYLKEREKLAQMSLNGGKAVKKKPLTKLQDLNDLPTKGLGTPSKGESSTLCKKAKDMVSHSINQIWDEGSQDDGGFKKGRRQKRDNIHQGYSTFENMLRKQHAKKKEEIEFQMLEDERELKEKNDKGHNVVEPMDTTTCSPGPNGKLEMPIEAITFADIKGKVKPKDLCLDDLMKKHKGVKLMQEEQKAAYEQRREEFKAKKKELKEQWQKKQEEQDAINGNKPVKKRVTKADKKKAEEANQEEQPSSPPVSDEPAKKKKKKKVQKKTDQKSDSELPKPPSPNIMRDVISTTPKRKDIKKAPEPVQKDTPQLKAPPKPPTPSKSKPQDQKKKKPVVDPKQSSAPPKPAPAPVPSKPIPQKSKAPVPPKKAQPPTKPKISATLTNVAPTEEFNEKPYKAPPKPKGKSKGNGAGALSNLNLSATLVTKPAENTVSTGGATAASSAASTKAAAKKGAPAKIAEASKQIKKPNPFKKKAFGRK